MGSCLQLLNAHKVTQLNTAIHVAILSPTPPFPRSGYITSGTTVLVCAILPPEHDPPPPPPQKKNSERDVLVNTNFLEHLTWLEELDLELDLVIGSG